MKRLVFEQPDGSIRINVPNEKMRLQDETDDVFYIRMEAMVRAQDLSLATLPVTIMDTTDLPTVRTDRNKWRIAQRGGKLIVEVRPEVAPVA